ncbi:hypothetical protein ABR738_14810 [Streptomyces sp. Edi4]|uniref:hypothetical protein n=1 Tax=Streptomyces sp. Edi4 TaxID=3162527 RepID=UPI0033060493
MERPRGALPCCSACAFSSGGALELPAARVHLLTPHEQYRPAAEGRSLRARPSRAYFGEGGQVTRATREEREGLAAGHGERAGHAGNAGRSGREGAGGRRSANRTGMSSRTPRNSQLTDARRLLVTTCGAVDAATTDATWVVRDGHALGILLRADSPQAGRLRAGSRVLVAGSGRGRGEVRGPAGEAGVPGRRGGLFRSRTGRRRAC